MSLSNGTPPPRFVIPDQPQHVIVRGNNRDPIFLDDEDHQFYLEKLKQACEKHQCALHAYVLMTNHVHLLITPHTEQGLSKVMQMIGRYYVQYFNHSYQRTGTLWEGRYKATLIDSECYLLTCYRYNALGQKNKLITPHDEYLQLGDNAAERQQAYRDLFNDHITQRTLADIRQATNKAWILGSQHFKDKIEQ